MLASDVNNPAFVGATDPDAALVVMFYDRPVQDNFKSSKEGRAIFSDVVYIKINTPGMRERSERRFLNGRNLRARRLRNSARSSSSPSRLSPMRRI